jgi:hypothetical protein
MQRFEFQLEKALEWRVTRLKEEEVRLAQMRQEKTSMQRLRADIEKAAIETGRVISENSIEINGAELSLLAECGRSTRTRLKRLAAQIRECDNRIAQQVRVAVQADREKQLLENLKEEQFAEWNHELNREIEATAGELYLARWTPGARGRS